MNAKKQFMNKWFFGIALYNLIGIVFPFGFLFILALFSTNQVGEIFESLIWIFFLVFLGMSNIALIKGARWAWFVQMIFFLSQIAVVRIGDKLFLFNLNLLKFGFSFKPRFLETNVDITVNLIPVIICVILLARIQKSA